MSHDNCPICAVLDQHKIKDVEQRQFLHTMYVMTGQLGELVRQAEQHGYCVPEDVAEMLFDEIDALYERQHGATLN